MDCPSPSMPLVYVSCVPRRRLACFLCLPGAGKRLVCVLEVGRGSRLRLLGCLPKRLTAAAHRRAEFFRPSPPVPARGLRCVGRGVTHGEVGRGERED